MQTKIDAHSFAGGVIEPRLWNRVNLDGYKIGAAVLDNVVTLPQGGVTRRPGLEYIDELPVEAKLIPFSFSTEENYMLAFYVDGGVEKMNVYIGGSLVQNINGSGDDYYDMSGILSYSNAQILACNWVQSADTLFVVNENFPPFSIVRTSDTAWTAQVITLKNVPTVDFDDTSSPATSRKETQNLAFTGTDNGDRYRLTLEGVTTEDITWGDVADNTTRIQDALRTLPTMYPRKDVTVVNVSPQNYEVTFDGGLRKNWEMIQCNDPYGNGVKALVTQTQAGIARTEAVWSATRGWPRTIVFHDARVWIGGSRDLPQSIWGSCVSEFTQDYIDFDYGTGFDDEGIGITLDTDQVNAITAIVSGRHLQVLTTGGEFVSMDHPITPNNVAFTRQSKYGSSDVSPVSIDGATLFIQRTGKALREYLYTDVEQAYTANSLSLLASHVLATPVDMDALVGTSDDDANYVYIVNADGTVATFNTLRDMEIAGWTTFSTDGSFLRVAVDDQTPYFMVKRTIEGVDVYYLEALNPECYMDSSVLYGTNTVTFAGLGHLEGETVRVKADGAILSDAVVASGEITADRASVTSAEIGLNFNTTVTTLPLNQETQQGSTVMRKARVVRTTLHLYESLGVLVDGERLADMSFPGTLGASNDPFTGLKEIRNLGWGRLQQQTFSQVDPVPMTILGVEYLMKVNF